MLEELVTETKKVETVAGSKKTKSKTIVDEKTVVTAVEGDENAEPKDTEA